MNFSNTTNAAPPSLEKSNIFQGITNNNYSIGENNDNFQNNDQTKNLISQFQNMSTNDNKKIFVPRNYQIEIFNEAKKQNSIIYVETGRGKTFISIMLMADLLKIDIQNPLNTNKNIDKRKKIIFFVCDAALVEQQKKSIEEILKIQVGIFQGKKSKKAKSDYETFREKWNSLNIFIAIPAIIYKLLSCGYFNIFEVSMLIFDECHHTNADHYYNKIMNEFYFFYKKKIGNNPKGIFYPKIYGLTASPLKNGIKETLEITAHKAMETLCENLDCVFVIDPEMKNAYAEGIKSNETLEEYLNSDHYEIVQPHKIMTNFKKLAVILINEFYYKILLFAFADIQNKLPNPESIKNIIKEYLDEMIKKRIAAESLEDYNKISMEKEKLYNLRKLSPLFIIFEKLQRQIFMILENLCLDSLISFFEKLIIIYNDLVKIKEEESKNKIYDVNDSCYSVFYKNEEDNENYFENDVSSLRPETIKTLLGFYMNIYKKLVDFQKNYDYFSDRLIKLYGKVNDLFHKNENSVFIIFITNRIVAHFLSPALTKFLKQNFPTKKCQEVIGVNQKKNDSGTSLTPSMTLSKLNETIKNFNSGNFNILIGTSAIEEGIDIQSCNAVISLMQLRTPKSFIQIKGRARKANSEFLIFTLSDKEEKIKIKKFILIGEEMRKFFNNCIVQDFKRNNFLSDKKDFLYKFDVKSHAKITLGNATEFLNEIKQQILGKNIKFNLEIEIKRVLSEKKEVEFEFQGVIILDTDLERIKPCFSKGPWVSEKFRSKDKAEKFCNFYVIILLKEAKYLDEHIKFVGK